MKYDYVFNNNEKNKLVKELDISTSPYKDFSSFQKQLFNRIYSGYFCAIKEVAGHIILRRIENKYTYLIGNCPIDEKIVHLGNDTPTDNKYKNKNKFISEAFMFVIAHFLNTPLLSYKTRNNGDFFTDVVALNELEGKFSGFTADDIIYHNDRTAHPVRADYISLLGLRCPEDNKVYTNYIDIADILKYLSKDTQDILKSTNFITYMDDYSQKNNAEFSESAKHAILYSNEIIRYQDILTKCTEDASILVIKALLEFKNALVRAPKNRCEIKTGDLFIFPNQRGLHNREVIEKNNKDSLKKRWLLKTYSFKNEESALRHKAYYDNTSFFCANDNL